MCRKPEVATQALKSNAGNVGHQSYTAVPKGEITHKYLGHSPPRSLHGLRSPSCYAMRWLRSSLSEAGLMGIITMEDVIEELLQEEVRSGEVERSDEVPTNFTATFLRLSLTTARSQIFDETDKYEKVQRKRANKVIKRWRNYIHKKRIERGEDPGTIRSFENAVDAKRRKEAKQVRRRSGDG